MATNPQNGVFKGPQFSLPMQINLTGAPNRRTVLPSYPFDGTGEPVRQDAGEETTVEYIVGEDGVEGKDGYALHLCEVCETWYNAEDMVESHLCIECVTFLTEDLENE